MAIAEVAKSGGEANTRDFLGLSSDTKPTENVPVYSTFLETDTKVVYVYTGAAWVDL